MKETSDVGRKCIQLMEFSYVGGLDFEAMYQDVGVLKGQINSTTLSCPSSELIER